MHVTNGAVEHGCVAHVGVPVAPGGDALETPVDRLIDVVAVVTACGDCGDCGVDDDVLMVCLAAVCGHELVFCYLVQGVVGVSCSGGLTCCYTLCW